jgi:hypothetical protein
VVTNKNMSATHEITFPAIIPLVIADFTTPLQPSAGPLPFFQKLF